MGITITPFNAFDANEMFVIEIIGDGNNLSYYSMLLQDIDIGGNEKEIFMDNIRYSSANSVEEYIDNNPSVITNYNPTMVKCNYNYYLILPQNYCVNGSRYSLNLMLTNDSSDNYIEYSCMHTFKCYSDPIIQLEYGKYQDGTLINIAEGATELTIEKSFCDLYFSYTQDEGDALKYYQFFLYKDIDGIEQWLGSSKKIYSSNNIVYSVENYNNLQEYILKLHCVTQSNNEQWLNITFKTDYNQDNIYADITFLLDKEKATNNVSFSIIQLNGDGENYSFDKKIVREEVDCGEGQITITQEMVDNGLYLKWVSDEGWDKSYYDVFCHGEPVITTLDETCHKIGDIDITNIIAIDENHKANVGDTIDIYTGRGFHAVYTKETKIDDIEYVTIQDSGYVNFVDTYQTIAQNFLCRIWCRGLSANVPILTIKNTDGDGYIEVVFTGQNFVAYKYSCGLTASYVSNNLTKNISENQDVYFAIGYYNGRIEMYTTII